MLQSDKIEIRQMQVTDMKSVMQIKNAENWNQTEKDWQFLINSSPETCLVAVLKGQVIGTVTALNYQNKVAWIGMMLVSKDFRGMGISKLLLNTIIKKLKGCTSIKLDATPAGIPVYKKLGFVEEYKIGRMVLNELCDVTQNKLGTKAILGITQIFQNDISAIASLDKVLFGVNRLNLFQFLFKSQKKICFQIKQKRQLKGYVLGRSGSNYTQIGPVMAHSTQFAKTLLYRVFHELKNQPLVIDILLDKSELKYWLISIGFEHQRSFTRMYLKSNKYKGKIENQFLISGPELG